MRSQRGDLRALPRGAGGRAACWRSFPEGTSHSDPQLRPLKTGAARIALSAEAEHDGRLGVTIVPVGLAYERKTLFRSSVLLVVGEPLAVAPLLPDYHRDERGAVDGADRRDGAAPGCHRAAGRVAGALGGHRAGGALDQRGAGRSRGPTSPRARAGRRVRAASGPRSGTGRRRRRRSPRVLADLAPAGCARPVGAGDGPATRGRGAGRRRPPRVGGAAWRCWARCWGGGPTACPASSPDGSPRTRTYSARSSCWPARCSCWSPGRPRPVAVAWWRGAAWALPAFGVAVASGYVALRFQELLRDGRAAWRALSLRAFHFNLARRLADRRRALADAVARALDEES